MAKIVTWSKFPKLVNDFASFPIHLPLFGATWKLMVRIDFNACFHYQFAIHNYVEHSRALIHLVYEVILKVLDLAQFFV